MQEALRAEQIRRTARELASSGKFDDYLAIEHLLIAQGLPEAREALEGDSFRQGWRRLNGLERAVRTCFAYFRQRSSQRFHARSRWRECEAGDGLRRTTISGEEEKDWRLGRELRRNADIVART
jgi:hypothetical protein